MLRVLTITILLAATAFAGCIAPPQDDSVESAAILPPPESDGKMTRDSENDETSTSPCLVPPNVVLPGASPYCAERQVVVGGDLTLTSLPVLIDGGAADIFVETGDADEWLATFILTSQGSTADEAESNVDSVAVTAEIGEPGAHALTLTYAPPQNTPVSVDILLRLPAATLYEMLVDTGSGDVQLSGLRTTTTTVDGGSSDVTISGDWLAQILLVDVGSGDMDIDADVRSATLDAGSGDIAATLRTFASGTIQIGTGSGSVDLSVLEDKRHGYEISVNTGSGDSTISLKDGRVQSEDEEDVAFSTTGFAAREIGTIVSIGTGSGDVTVTAAK